MRISEILEKKGSEVVTVRPDVTVATLLGELADEVWKDAG